MTNPEQKLNQMDIVVTLNTDETVQAWMFIIDGNADVTYYHRVTNEVIDPTTVKSWVPVRKE